VKYGKDIIVVVVVVITESSYDVLLSALYRAQCIHFSQVISMQLSLTLGSLPITSGCHWTATEARKKLYIICYDKKKYSRMETNFAIVDLEMYPDMDNWMRYLFIPRWHNNNNNNNNNNGLLGIAAKKLD